MEVILVLVGLLADKSAFNTLQVLRQDLVALNRNIQFNFRDSIEPLYRKLLYLLLRPELDSNQPNVANIKTAVRVIESLKLAELDNFFQDACVSAQSKSTLNSSLISVLSQFKLSLRSVQKKIKLS